MSKRKNQDEEYKIQVALAEYIILKYPDVEFRSDLGGIKLTMGQAVKIKKVQKNKSWPDMFVAEARNGYHGLFLEFKKDHDELFTKNGEYRENEHINNQKDMLNKLKEKGYYAAFVCGIDGAMRAVDYYLGGIISEGPN